MEYKRDIKPIFQAKCHSCHTAGGSGEALVMDQANDYEFYSKILNRSRHLADGSKNPYWPKPIMSKYIRVPQARESMLVWVAYGERLDGRTNASRVEDIDYPDGHPEHNLTFNEKRLISRWVDLGIPINFENEDGFGYTRDNQLPVIHVYSPTRSSSPNNQKIRFGVNDSQSGIDWATLTINYALASSPEDSTAISSYTKDNKGIVSAALPALEENGDYILAVSVNDNAGNNQTEIVRFTSVAGIARPATPNVVAQ